MNKYEEAIANIRNHFCNYCKKNSCVKCEWYQDLTDLEELVDKYRKHREYHHPLLKPCTCGHNRRNRYVKWARDKHQKMWGYECKGCGFTVWSESEMGAKHEWNKQIDIKANNQQSMLVANEKTD